MEVALLLGVMMILLAYGVPIAFSIGISSSVFLMVTQMKPLILIAQRTVLGTDSFPRDCDHRLLYDFRGPHRLRPCNGCGDWGYHAARNAEKRIQ